MWPWTGSNQQSVSRHQNPPHHHSPPPLKLNEFTVPGHPGGIQQHSQNLRWEEIDHQMSFAVQEMRPMCEGILRYLDTFEQLRVTREQLVPSSSIPHHETHQKLKQSAHFHSVKETNKVQADNNEVIQQQCKELTKLKKELDRLKDENEDLKQRLKAGGRNTAIKKMQQSTAAESEVLSLKKELARMKAEKNEAMQNKLPDPEVVDHKFRGGKPSPEKTVQLFFTKKYSHALERMDDDFKDIHLGKLLGSLSEICYGTCAHWILQEGIYNTLQKLFSYQPEALKTEAEASVEYQDLHHAYGLLLCYSLFNKESIHMHTEKLKRQVEEKIKRDQELSQLFEKAKQISHDDFSFNEFFDKLIDTCVNMVTVSPPMIFHKPEVFDKKQAMPISPGISTHPPLLWIQPVVMKNLYGGVCVLGRAGNIDDLERLAEK